MGKIGRLLAGGFCVVAIGGSVYGVVYRQDISDWLTLRNYTPTTRVEALAERTSMTPKSKKLFYVYDPQLLDKNKFNSSCQVSEKTIVLGCYNGTGIYLYDITDPKLSGVEEVTSAHEMLHAAYDRLSSKEKNRIDALLQQTFDGVTDQRIRSLVEQYRLKDPSSVNNEMHSIFGTELRTLPPELETYYQQYFSNRQRIVDYSEKYEQVFIDIDEQVSKLDGDLSLRKAEIDQKEAKIESDSNNLQAWRTRLDALAAEGKNEEYNAQIPEYNQAVNTYNNDLKIVRELVKEYNQLVEERNNLALQQNKLVQSIDSKAADL